MTPLTCNLKLISGKSQSSSDIAVLQWPIQSELLFNIKDDLPLTITNRNYYQLITDCTISIQETHRIERFKIKSCIVSKLTRVE